MAFSRAPGDLNRTVIDLVPLGNALSLRLEGDLDLLNEYFESGVMSSFSPEKSMQLSFFLFLEANLLLLTFWF